MNKNNVAHWAKNRSQLCFKPKLEYTIGMVEDANERGTNFC